MGDDMSESIKVSARFPVGPERLYRAWLDSTEHGRFTGGGADIEPVVGGRFMSWDDYMTGMLLQLDPGRRIVMTWRTTEFPETAPDSRLEVVFEAEGDGTRLTLIHTDIPQGEGDKCEDGWIDYYFEPMQRYFRKIAAEESQPRDAAVKRAKPARAAAKKSAAKKVVGRKAVRTGKKAARRKAAKVAKKAVRVKLAVRAARKSAGRAKVRAGNRRARHAAKRK
jgi:uncharacterized protein YndB with AHSA1/START domain